MTGRARVVIAVLIAALPLRSVGARAPEDRREVQGRTLFAKGDYQAALDVYATLFAEKGDAIYLRNVGRCYQKLEQPEKAINAFREYLRRAHVKRAEREEVDGFIKEMEDLQKQRAATTPPAAEPVHAGPGATDTPPPPPPPAITEPPPPPQTSAPGATLTQEASQPEPSSEGSEGSITGRWWFWTGLAVLVAGGAVGAYLIARPHNGTMPACVSTATMQVECP